MKCIIKKIIYTVMAIFVILLSIGLNISKMKCAEVSTIYLGSKVPSCSQKKVHESEQIYNKVNCCILEIEKYCCSQAEDKSCTIETELVHFDFETLITFSNYDFSLLIYPIINIICSDVFSFFKSLNNFQSGIPPPKLTQPILSQIQSFLL